MSLKQKLAVPNWAPDTVKAEWDSWTQTQQDYWRNNNFPGSTQVVLPPAEEGQEAPKLPDPETVGKAPDGRIVQVYTETSVEDWNRDLMLDGKLVPAKRIRYAILEHIEKDSWHAKNMSNGYVERQLARILADSTPGWEPESENPLIVQVVKRLDGEEFRIPEIRRKPKNEAERQRIRKRFGVTAATAPWLAKEDCPKCKGTGKYYVPAYPGDPIYGRLPETVECGCCYE
jgi:hypothetical protein